MEYYSSNGRLDELGGGRRIDAEGREPGLLELVRSLFALHTAARLARSQHGNARGVGIGPWA